VDFAKDYLTYVKPNSPLLGAEVACLVLYTSQFSVKSSLYAEVNKALRENKDRKELALFKKYLWTLNVALQKCPTFNGTLL